MYRWTPKSRDIAKGIDEVATPVYVQVDTRANLQNLSFFDCCNSRVCTGGHFVISPVPEASGGRLANARASTCDPSVA